MFNRFTFIIGLFLASLSSLSAQKPAFSPDEVLIGVRPDVDMGLLQRRMAQVFSKKIYLDKNIAPAQRVWRVKTDADMAHRALAWLENQPEISAAQLNWRLIERKSPDDPLLPQQWQYVNHSGVGLPGSPANDLDADLAWDISTGGLTPAGDTIVVAMIDSGLDFEHPDLRDNLWVNHAERPDNHLDDDGNGYIDDHRGWNTWAQNDDLSGKTTAHGTPIAGIIGARGNNGLGVSGVNWQVKMMFVAGGGTLADLLAAYDYVLTARKRYNATHGKQGAFVVAVNCSFGTDYGDPSQSPLWCAAFDSLGRHGILSVAATANKAIDVDVWGDLPTTCPSDFLVAVTNVTQADKKAENAAWGKQHIDLGAYGEEVFTTANGSAYGRFSGTSFAAPHVSGAIGLLYASPCPALISEMKIDPQSAALSAKKILLNGTKPIETLQNKSVTGGRLNLYQVLKNYEAGCPDCPAPFAVLYETPAPGEVKIIWSQSQDNQLFRFRYRPDDASLWLVLDNVQSGMVLKNLTSCHSYQFALQSVCAQQAGPWSAVQYFRSGGCCEPPEKIGTLDEVGSEAALLAWSSVQAALGYTVRYRTEGQEWVNLFTKDTRFNLEDLRPCTQYEVQILSDCPLGKTDFSKSFFFKTAGCGACLEKDYCAARASHTDDEWISEVKIGDFTHVSAKSNGYMAYTQQSIALRSGQSVPVRVSADFTGQGYKEFFRIYLDANADGDFEDAGELVFDPGFAFSGPASGHIMVPMVGAALNTRLRVMMKFAGSANTKGPEPCEEYGFGEVEDYCVRIEPAFNSVSGAGHSFHLRIFPQPAADVVWVEMPDKAQTLRVFDMGGRVIFQQKNEENGLQKININDWMSGVYNIEILTSEGGAWRTKLLKQ